MGFAGCRTSGVLTGSNIVNKGQTLLISIHATELSGSTAEIRIWDSTSADTGTEVARIRLTANQTIEFDMHGVVCKNGLYFEEESGSVTCSIEFA